MGVFKFCTVELWNWVSNEILVQYFSVSLRCYCASKIRRESLHLVCSDLLCPHLHIPRTMEFWMWCIFGGNFKMFYNVGTLILALENTPSLNLLWMIWKITIWTGGQFAILLVESESWTTSWRNENKPQSRAQAHIYCFILWLLMIEGLHQRNCFHLQIVYLKSKCTFWFSNPNLAAALEGIWNIHPLWFLSCLLVVPIACHGAQCSDPHWLCQSLMDIPVCQCLSWHQRVDTHSSHLI